MLSGGCACGEVRYETTGVPFNASNCHCSMCRRSAGAAFVTWFSVPRASVRFTRGELRFYRSSPKARRGFCPQCGSQVTFEDDAAPADVDLTMCSLDDPAQLAPVDEIHTGSKVAWVPLDATLPAYRGARRDG